jgi:dihydrofolate reductase
MGVDAAPASTHNMATNGGIDVKASVFVGASVDGFIARADGRLDFLDHSGSEPHGYDEFIATVDAIVMGRNTLEIVLGFNMWPFKKPVFVLSTRPLPALPSGVAAERLEGEPADVVKQLEERGFGSIYVDGGITIQRFLDAGLIDRLIVSRVPVLVGSGIPLFGPLTHDVVLRHVATRQFASGLVQTEYAVTKLSERA